MKRDAFEDHEALLKKLLAVLDGEESALVGATLGELLAGWLCLSYPEPTEREAVAEMMFTAIRQMLVTEPRPH